VRRASDNVSVRIFSDADGMTRTQSYTDSAQVERAEALDPLLVAATALGLPGVTWAIIYWPSDDGHRCRIAAAAGDVPTVLRDFDLPLDRLPPPVVRALLKDSIEQGRFSVLWLANETGNEISEADLEGLKGLTTIPLRISPAYTALMLLGTTTRSPQMGPFIEFRSNIEGRVTGTSETDGIAQEHLAVLETEFRLLSQNSLLFQARMAVEMARSQRYRRHLSLLTFEMGHAGAGPEQVSIMTETAIALRRHLRLSDIVGRIDAKTIGVVLPETSESHALWISPRLGRIVQEFLARNGLPTNITIGLASRPTSPEAPADFIRRAMVTIVPTA
jgi:hypothetical protein